MPFGKRLKEARLQHNMTQEDLAKAVGVTKGAIGNYESEISSPKETILIKLMEVLQIDANYLYHDYIHTSGYSEKECRLVTAYRAADPRYQDLALELLEEHPLKKDISSVAE